MGVDRRIDGNRGRVWGKPSGGGVPVADSWRPFSRPRRLVLL